MMSNICQKHYRPTRAVHEQTTYIFKCRCESITQTVEDETKFKEIEEITESLSLFFSALVKDQGLSMK
jgi:hypothetical protein